MNSLQYPIRNVTSNRFFNRREAFADKTNIVTHDNLTYIAYCSLAKYYCIFCAKFEDTSEHFTKLNACPILEALKRVNMGFNILYKHQKSMLENHTITDPYLNKEIVIYEHCWLHMINTHSINYELILRTKDYSPDCCLFDDNIIHPSVLELYLSLDSKYKIPPVKFTITEQEGQLSALDPFFFAPWNSAEPHQPTPPVPCENSEKSFIQSRLQHMELEFIKFREAYNSLYKAITCHIQYSVNWHIQQQLREGGLSHEQGDLLVTEQIRQQMQSMNIPPTPLQETPFSHNESHSHSQIDS